MGCQVNCEIGSGKVLRAVRGRERQTAQIPVIGLFLKDKDGAGVHRVPTQGHSRDRGTASESELQPRASHPNPVACGVLVLDAQPAINQGPLVRTGGGHASPGENRSDRRTHPGRFIDPVPPWSAAELSHSPGSCPSSSDHVGNIVSPATGAVRIQIDIVGIPHQGGPIRNQISLGAGQQDADIGLVELARRSRRRGQASPREPCE